MPYSLNSAKEEILEISPPGAEAPPSLQKAGLEKKEKVTTEDGPDSGQEIKGKAQDNKKAEKKEKVKIRGELQWYSFFLSPSLDKQNPFILEETFKYL